MSAPQADELDLRLLRFRKSPAAAEGLALAEALIAASRERDALSVYDQLRKGAPRDASLPHRAGKVLLALGELPGAQAILLEALQVAPEDAAIAATLGEVLLKRGEPARAKELLARHRGDAAVDKLYGRAERLARLSADVEPEAEPAPPAPKPAAPPAPKPAAPPAPKPAAPPAPKPAAPPAPKPAAPPAPKPAVLPPKPAPAPTPAPKPAASMPTASAHERVTAPTGPSADDAAGFFEDVPTAMIDRSQLEALRDARHSVAEERVSTTPPPALEVEVERDETREIQLEADMIPMPEPETRSWSGGTLDDEPEDAILEESAIGAPLGERASERRGRAGWRGPLVVLSVALVVAAAVGAYFAYDLLLVEDAERARELRAEADRVFRSGEPAGFEAALEQVDEAAELAPADVVDESIEAFGRAVALLELESGDVARTRAAAERVEGPLRDAARGVVDFVSTREPPALSAIPLPSKALDPRASFLLGRLRQASGGDPSLDFELAVREDETTVPAARLERALVSLARGEREAAEAALGEGREGSRAAMLRLLIDPERHAPDELASASPAPFDRFLGALVRAELHVARGRSAEARAELASLEPSLVRGPIGPMLAARAARRAGDLELAKKLAAQAMERSEGDHARAFAVEIALEGGDLERARELLVDLSGEKGLAMAMDLARRTGQREDAERAREALAEAELSEAVAGAHRLWLALIEQAPSETLDRLAASLVDSDEGPALLARAELALARDDFEKALELATRSAESLPESALADRVVGVSALALGDAERAEAALRRASEGGDPVARARLAELRLAEGEAGEAADLLSEDTLARLGEGERVSAIRARALALAETGDLGAASEALAALEGLDDEETIALRSKIAILAGEPEATVEALEARVAPLIKKGKAKPEDAPVLVAYAAALEASGDTKTAGSAYQLAVRSEPTSIEARIGYARALIRGRKEGQALRVLERGSNVLEERGEQPPTEFLLLRGRALLEQGKRAEATISLLEASTRDDAPAETYFYLAEALAGRKTAESRAAYERYLELEPTGPHGKRAERAIER